MFRTVKTLGRTRRFYGARMCDGVEFLDQNPKGLRMSKKEQLEETLQREHMKKLEALTSLPDHIVVDPMLNQCRGCGVQLQSDDPESPGFLPPRRSSVRKYLVDADEDSESEDTKVIEVKLGSEDDKIPVCQRCYKLSHYGVIADSLRVKPVVEGGPAVTLPFQTETGPVTSRGRSVLSAARFRACLEGLRKKTAVIVYLVDIFDFHGTFLTSLQDIVGTRNPLLLAVNKVDLLPPDFKASRVEQWVRSECSSLGLHQISGVHMVSSRRGTGVADVIADAVRTARGRRCDIYVVGAANVGKSSFINKVVGLRKDRKDTNQKRRRGKSGQALSVVSGALTTSVIPGTTLDTVRIPLNNAVNLYDTPGIIVNHQITNRLSADELRAVLPSKNVECVTYRLGEGKAIFLGGLARIDVIEGKPFFFTVFVSSNVKVHPGKIENAEEFAKKHCGGLLTPPFTSERLNELGQWTSKTFVATGEGWKRASLDVVLSGLGWVSITGPDSVKLRVNAPHGMGVFTRSALMPFEAKAGVSKYSGSRALSKRTKSSRNKRRHDDESFSSIGDIWN